MKRVQQFALGLAGITSLGVGAVILVALHAFYASYGIALGPDPNLLSELRASGAGLAALGAVMLAGTVRPALRQAAVVVALIVFLAFPAGRVLGFVADGMPSSGILAALVLELGIAALCLFAFRRGVGSTATGLAAR